MTYWIRILALLAGSTSVAYAQDTNGQSTAPELQPAYTDSGATLGISSARQIYESGDDGNGRQLYFSPYYIYDQWMFSAYVSAERVTGQYQSETQYPQLAQVCALQQSGSRVRFFDDAVDAACAEAETTYTEDTDRAGLNDIILFASYDVLLPDPNTGLSLGVSYSHDNGDYESGLGSGTRDLYTDISGRIYASTLTFWGSLGYTKILLNNTPFALEDYASGSVGVNWRAKDWLSLSTSANAQQASIENGDGYHYLSAGLNLGKSEGLGGFLTLYRYEDNPGLPEREIHAGVSYSF